MTSAGSVPAPIKASRAAHHRAKPPESLSSGEREEFAWRGFFADLRFALSLPRSQGAEAGQSPKPLRDSGIGPDSRARSDRV
jgi:hypothetical protein